MPRPTKEKKHRVQLLLTPAQLATWTALYTESGQDTPTAALVWLMVDYKRLKEEVKYRTGSAGLIN